jgi:oxygen-independent coproporphyrinogen-3 oxidase
VKNRVAPELLEKYGGRGPRYTSYPTAPHFDPEADHEALAQAWRESSSDLSLYCHLPFCQVRCLFCGCHVKITRQRERSVDYVDRLLRELDTASRLVEFSRPLRQLQLGGGTPNFLLPEQMRRLIEGVRERFAPASDSEWGIECDPRTIDRSYVELLAELGFNRFSFGVQDLDPEVMAAVARPQTVETVEEVVAAVREHDPRSLNLDLIFGLPRQTDESWARTLERVVALRPDRLAVFGYAHVPWMAKHQVALEKHELPGPELRARLAAAAREAFVSAGYVEIGFDHFALPEDEMAVALKQATLHRNFMGYTTQRGLDLLAVGTSAIAKVGRSFTQDSKDLAHWQDEVDAGRMPWERGLVLDDDDVLRGEVILELSCNARLDVRDIESRFGISFGEHFASELAQLRDMEADGLLSISDDEILLSETGRYLVRNACMVFDAWLEKGSSDAPRYSKTV